VLARVETHRLRVSCWAGPTPPGRFDIGSLYLANPDLLQRFAAGAPLNAPDRETFYSDGPRGYVDYPVLGQTLEVGQVDWRGAVRA
jgi:hypothetical protein